MVQLLCAFTLLAGIKKFHNRSTYLSNSFHYSSFPGVGFGGIFDGRNISSAESKSIRDLKIPTILRNAFLWDRDEWTQSLVENFKNDLVDYDVRDNDSGELLTFEAVFSEFLATVSDNSDHFNSIYLMNEEILQRLPKSREQFTLNSTIFDKDLFQHFPPLIRPRTALIIGGQGSRSFLHADPYEWTGWNYLVEGRKLCSFLYLDLE
jgi:hypothetical protein